MKSITILSLSLFEIAIAASLSFFFSPSPCLLIPFLSPFPSPHPSSCLFPHVSVPALTFIPPYLCLFSSPLLHSSSSFIQPLFYLCSFPAFISCSFIPSLCCCLPLPSISYFFLNISPVYGSCLWSLPTCPCLFLLILPFIPTYPLLCSLTLPSFFCLLSCALSTHPGRCDHRSHHRGGAGLAGAHCVHLLPDEVPGGAPRLQPQCQVSDRPVACGALPVRSVPGTGAEARAHPWH